MLGVVGRSHQHLWAFARDVWCLGKKSAVYVCPGRGRALSNPCAEGECGCLSEPDALKVSWPLAPTHLMSPSSASRCVPATHYQAPDQLPSDVISPILAVPSEATQPSKAPPGYSCLSCPPPPGPDPGPPSPPLPLLGLLSHAHAPSLPHPCSITS